MKAVMMKMMMLMKLMLQYEKLVDWVIHGRVVVFHGTKHRVFSNMLDLV